MKGLFKKMAFVAAAALFAFALGVATNLSGQNMSGTVVKKEIKFAKGKSEASVRGSAKYAMSYVYELGARAGQTMDVAVKAKNRELTFSLIGPDDETLEGAFGAREWSGLLPLTGRYSIVVVMNDEGGGAVPFTLTTRIK